ncbi:hypothetical protein IFM58399_08447 [Aspergillus lentulus]|uniref:Nucleoside phosphorylase domain-containing protein n=1 Tax=Aspergillus lentulus TaxID=293939 RepID=A0ABQ0ZXW6_ASPLE|nr:uncharacterized protein IFM58399_08447 [Aspergillus lentulus]GFF49002.1 hypothetical protein IFM58399_08447 [Aspergillus lentulus]GFF61771.1 hypothetical protein IFM62136_05138 [Aspergillus lentulus]GFF64824.1 hypothetical protein IFM60648_01397 [Aspergillus lentulus]GFF94830.1 hypothetical protein IFM47457_10049 [Aspergillus lentulus]GFG16320.1 hypothetical protein IFM61392_09444 [Aspergillus lentulus]
MAPTHDDYTVGWICALPRELAAARGMLDDEHESLYAAAADCNAYTLGRIGTHNVVLACLPVGEYGVVPAAVTVMRMKATFPKLEIGLLVGVGGGIPSDKHDIRLGDVVVGDTGVIHYDMGKTVQGGRFICTQERLRPPQGPLLAVSKLQAGHQLGKERISEYIDDMTRRYPEFSYPGVDLDVLFASGYDHPERNASCAQCDPSKRVSRKPRPSIRPVVHYGLIASGNQVMRHGATRDELRTEHDIFCFEMEAAGLMRVFPSLVVRGICDYSDSHKSKIWQDYAAVAAAAYAKELLTVIPGPLARQDRACFMVPFALSPKFVGRKTVLEMIDQKLEAKQPAVLAGMGGVGKTQLAVHYCYLYRERMPTAHVFWVNASTIANFEQGYRDIARALRLPGHEDPMMDPGPQVCECLSKNITVRWLMVLDNLDDAQTITSQIASIPGLGGSGGSIIVTTRDMRVSQYLPDWDYVEADPIALPPLDASDARDLIVELLAPEQRRDEADLLELIQMLGCFPLALTQAMAFIKQNRTTVTKYKKLLLETDVHRLHEKEYRDTRRYNDASDSVYRTWETSFRKIQQDEPSAAELLACMSMVDAQLGVPESVLCSSDWDPLAFTKAIGTLLSFSLITTMPGDSVVMHPMVQRAVRDFLTQEGSGETYQWKVFSRLAARFPDARVESWRYCDELAPHAEEVLRYVFKDRDICEMAMLDRATLLHNVAAHKGHRGRYPLARAQVEEAYEIRRNRLGDDSLDTLESLELLALILVNQGEYSLAEIKQRTVLDKRQCLTGADDILTLESQQALADILLRLGRLDEAIKLYEKALEANRAVRGALCRTSLELMDRLGEANEQQGRHSEAEKIYRQAVEGKKVLLGDEHESTVKTRISLDLLLGLQSGYDRAYDLYSNAIALSTRTFGEEHPDTIRLHCNLASLYLTQGNWEAAEEVQHQAHRTFARVLGEHHPSTLVCLSNLAVFKQRKGEYSQAEELHRSLYDRRSAILGVHHPYTLTSMFHLAEVLVELDQHAEASDLFEEVLTGRQGALGAKHPDTLRCMSSLAGVLDDLDQSEDAERMYLECLRLKREIFPPDHPEILTDLNNLAEVLRQSGELSQAESMHREALRLHGNRDAGLGSVSRANLGRVLYLQGRYDEAVDMFQQALASAGEAATEQSPFVEMVSDRLEAALRDQKEMRKKNGVYEWLQWVVTGPLMGRVWGKG